MSTSKLAVVLAATTLVGGGPSLATQGYLSPTNLYDQRTTFTKHNDWGSVCIWYGEEPDGTVIYAWENQQQCGGTVGVYGYDFNRDAKVEVVIWPARDPNCGDQIRAWQWYVNGQTSEYVRGDCLYDQAAQRYRYVVNYFSAPSGVGCNLPFMDKRRRDAYQTFINLQPTANTNRLNVKIAWHNYNQADLTYKACGGQ